MQSKGTAGASISLPAAFNHTPAVFISCKSSRNFVMRGEFLNLQDGQQQQLRQDVSHWRTLSSVSELAFGQHSRRELPSHIHIRRRLSRPAHAASHGASCCHRHRRAIVISVQNASCDWADRRLLSRHHRRASLASLSFCQQLMPCPGIAIAIHPASAPLGIASNTRYIPWL